MKKRNNQKGFTLSEVMIAMLIILMVTTIVAQGIPLAQRAYIKVVDSANAQVLLTNTVTVLRDEVGTATMVTVNDNHTVIEYASGKTGLGRKLEAGQNLGTNPTSAEDKGAGLVSSGLSGKQKMVIRFNGVQYDEVKGVVTFTELNVTKAGYSVPLAKLDSYQVRVINAE